ncbi:MAG: type II toxin-antitoxin system VapC family toxin [Leptospiraceae bacterium]|nr:type II toxin-antitoxin system VapC family toxin [Leptospiraceae bacterium]
MIGAATVGSLGAHKLTIDASVYLAALEKGEANEARAFLRRVLSEGYELYLPRLFLLELIVTLRAMLNVKSVYSLLARQWAIAENVRWLDADSQFTRAACELADQANLRVSDAIYAVTARISGGVLVSLDPAMLERVGSHVSVFTPASFIGSDNSTVKADAQGSVSAAEGESVSEAPEAENPSGDSG